MKDIIYRQAAIDALKEHRALYCGNTPDTFSRLSYAEKSRVDELDTAIATLVSLPSARPMRKKGKWKYIGFMVVECSECNTQLHGIECANFCSNCGADMREEQDEAN